MVYPSSWQALLVWPMVALTGVTASSPSCEMARAWDMGGEFSLTWSNTHSQLAISHGGDEIWSSVPGRGFLSASSGDDLVIESSGAFNITQVDENKCDGFNVTSTEFHPWDDGLNEHAVKLSGYLSDCGSGESSTAPYTAMFWVPRNLPDRVAFDAQVQGNPDAENPLTKVFFTFSSAADEDFYGLGAQASFASLKNQSVPIFTREQGVGRGDEPTTRRENAKGYFVGGNKFTTYTAVPQYISSSGNGFYLSHDTTALAFFDFTEQDAVTVRYDELEIAGHFLRADGMLDAISMATEYTGRMAPLPKWADEGAVIGIQGGQDKVNGIVKKALEADVPVVGVWLQDWSGTRLQETPSGVDFKRLWWNWESDEKLYPEWHDFVQNLRDEYGVRTMSYVNPFLANVSTKDDGFKRNLFAEAVAADYLVRNKSTGGASIIASGPDLNAGIVDLTNEGTREWFAEIMRDQIWAANISGYMCDFGEYTPVTPETGLADAGVDAFVYHNRYPRQWASYHDSVISSQIPQAPDAVLFYRSASLGSSSHMNLFWAGDQNPYWASNDGIPSAPRIMGHMGVSGFAQSHSDIGGYTATFVDPSPENPDGVVGRSAELLGRWGELAAVSSAFFRTHEGNVPDANAQPYTNATTLAWFGRSARMFRALAPYRRRVLDGDCAERGLPLLRMSVLHHPGDMRARNIAADSFFLGPDLYAAPVLQPGVFEVDVYLPGGTDNTYMHVWSGEEYNGGQTVTVKAPYGQPAVFLVDGADSDDLNNFMDFVEKERDNVVEV